MSDLACDDSPTLMHCFHDDPDDRESSVCCWCGDVFLAPRQSERCGDYAPLGHQTAGPGSAKEE